MKKLVTILIAIILTFSVQGLGIIAITPVTGDWINTWGIAGISITNNSSGATVQFSNANSSQRVSTPVSYNVNGLSIRLTNVSVPSGQKISLALVNSAGAWYDTKSLFFIIDPNVTTSAVVITGQGVSGLSDMYLNTTASLGTTIDIAFYKSSDSLWKLVLNNQAFDITDSYFTTCLDNYNSSFLSMGNWNWGGGSPTVTYTINDVSKTTNTLNNASLIPVIAAQSSTTVDSNGTPDWVKSLITVNIRLDLIDDTDGDGNKINEAKKIVDHYAEMGINSIWFNPVFERDIGSPAQNNGYKISNNENIEQDIVGTSSKAAGRTKFKELVDYAHSKNIRIFLDMVVWGTATNNPLVTANPTFYLKSGGNFVTYNGGYVFDWTKTALKTWYINNAVSLVTDMAVDGFRCDLEPWSGFGTASASIWVNIQSNAWTTSGRRISIFSEISNQNRSQFDFEQLGVAQQTVKHGSEDYFLNNNIVDAVTTGVGIGDQTRSASTKGTYQYYTNNITCHDTGATDTTVRDYSTHRNPLILGYQAIFAPFIPIWYAGEEFDNPFNQVENGGGTLYFSKLDYTLKENEGNKQFFEETKKMIRIRLLYPEIFTSFPANHRTANIIKVTSTNTAIQSYARYSGGKGILVIPNNSSTKIQSTVSIPYSSMGMGGKHYRIYDLMSDKLIAAGTMTELTTVNVEILGKNQRVLLVEADDGTAYGPQNFTGTPTVRMAVTHSGSYTSAKQLVDYWNQGLSINKVQKGVSLGVSNTDGGGWARRASIRQRYKLSDLNIKLSDLNLGSGKIAFGLYNIDTNTSSIGNWTGSNKTLLFILDKINGSYSEGGTLLGRYGNPESGIDYFTGYRRFYAPISDTVHIKFKQLEANTWALIINGEAIMIPQSQLVLNSGSVQRGLVDFNNLYIDFGIWSGTSTDTGSYTISQIFNGTDYETLNVVNITDTVSNVYGSGSNSGVIRDTWNAMSPATLGNYDSSSGRTILFNNSSSRRFGTTGNYCLDNLTFVIKNFTAPDGSICAINLGGSESAWYDSNGIMFLNQTPSTGLPNGQIIVNANAGQVLLNFLPYSANPFTSNEMVFQFKRLDTSTWSYNVNGQQMGTLTSTVLAANGINPNSAYISFGNWASSPDMSYSVKYIGYNYLPTAPSPIITYDVLSKPTSTCGNTTVNLAWTAAVNNAIGNVAAYRIERYLGNTLQTTYKVTAATLSYNDTGLSRTTLYTYRIKALDSYTSATPNIIAVYLLNASTTT